jgi:hypothetical protein
MSEAFAPTTDLAPIDNELVARLLAEALARLDEDRLSARRHIERARSGVRPLARTARQELARRLAGPAHRWLHPHKHRLTLGHAGCAQPPAAKRCVPSGRFPASRALRTEL